MALTKGLIFDRFSWRVFDMRRVTLAGYRSMPATRAWPKGCTLLPLSTGWMMTTWEVKDEC